MDSILVNETWVKTLQGRLFVKRWTPIPEEISSSIPIILIHDSLGCVELWRDFPVQLSRAAGREVIAYDRLGFGKSDACSGSLEAGFVRDEERYLFPAICDHLGIEQFVVFGHSLGGGMGVECAAAMPDRCTVLITESAQAFIEGRTLDGIRKARRIFAQKDQLDRLRKYHGDKADWVLSAWVDTWLSEQFRNWSLDRTLPFVRCPVLAIHGRDDEYGSIRHPERIARLSTGLSRIKILDDCGHIPHREKTKCVLQTVGMFLASQK